MCLCLYLDVTPLSYTTMKKHQCNSPREFGTRDVIQTWAGTWTLLSSSGTHGSELLSSRPHICTHAETLLLGVQGLQTWSLPSFPCTVFEGSGHLQCRSYTLPLAGHYTREVSSTPGNQEEWVRQVLVLIGSSLSVENEARDKIWCRGKGISSGWALHKPHTQIFVCRHTVWKDT